MILAPNAGRALFLSIPLSTARVWLVLFSDEDGPLTEQVLLTTPICCTAEVGPKKVVSKTKTKNKQYQETTKRKHTWKQLGLEKGDGLGQK